MKVPFQFWVDLCLYYIIIFELKTFKVPSILLYLLMFKFLVITDHLLAESFNRYSETFLGNN